MSSVVDICNLALANLGDNATVASIDPPEGSAQAEHCARFFPLARDTLLEMHAWGFATRRKRLARLDTDTWTWQFAYAVPSDAINLLAVLPASAASDAKGEPFERESGDNGVTMILTNVEDATLRYVANVTDPTVFSPLFITALSWQLAAMIAGPVLKGDAGAAEAKRCTAMAQAFLSKASVSDANQRKVDTEHTPDWIAGR